MRFGRRLGLLALFAALLGGTLLACGGKTLELGTEPLYHRLGGFTIRYPAGWQHENNHGQIVFYESEQARQSAPANLMVMIETAALTGTMAGVSNAREMLTVFEANLAQRSAFQFGPVWDTQVGGQPAAAVAITGTVESVDVAARIVAVYVEGRGSIVIGRGQVELWKPFIPTFEAMLDSMTFFEPQ